MQADKVGKGGFSWWNYYGSYLDTEGQLHQSVLLDVSFVKGGASNREIENGLLIGREVEILYDSVTGEIYNYYEKICIIVVEAVVLMLVIIPLILYMKKQKKKISFDG